MAAAVFIVSLITAQTRAVFVVIVVIFTLISVTAVIFQNAAAIVMPAKPSVALVAIFIPFFIIAEAPSFVSLSLAKASCKAVVKTIAVAFLDPLLFSSYNFAFYGRPLKISF